MSSPARHQVQAGDNLICISRDPEGTQYWALPLPAMVREQLYRPGGRHAHPCLRCQGCRPRSWLWTSKQCWNSVPASLTHDPGPVLPVQGPPGGLAGLLLGTLWAAPIYAFDNRLTTCIPNCGHRNGPLSATLLKKTLDAVLSTQGLDRTHTCLSPW